MILIFQESFLRVLRAQSARASPVRRASEAQCEAREKKRLSPVLLSVFSLVPDLLFECSRVLEYAEIRTVLQCIRYLVNKRARFMKKG